jgi:hypothetical protein
MFNDAVKCNAAGDTPRTYASNQGTEGLLTLPVISLVVLLLWGLALNLCSVELLLHFLFVDVPAFLGYLTTILSYLFLISFIFNDAVKCNAAGDTPRTYASHQGTEGLLILPGISLVVLLLWGLALHSSLCYIFILLTYQPFLATWLSTVYI